MEARLERADIFSVGHFESGLKAFNRAVEDSIAGKSTRRIEKRLAEARACFEKALQTTELMRSTFPELISAYDNANAANAQAFAAGTYEQAMDIFVRVVEKLEKADPESAAEGAAQAAAMLDQAELEAIQSEILGPARESLAKGVAGGCIELTPFLYTEALKTIQRAERHIKENRYDRETSTRMAQEAGDILSHMLYLTDWITRLRESPGSWEKLILQYERYIGDISSTLHLSPRFERDVALSIEAILAAIRSLQDDRFYLQGELAVRDSLIGTREAEVSKLRSQSGLYMAELELKRQQILAKKRFEEKISRITSLLKPEEGTIAHSTSGELDQITVRLTGLKFPSGSSQIRPDDFALLTRVQQVIREFPHRRIEVHGHSDSKGDEVRNLNLSQARANAVRDYLVINMNLQEDDIEAIGFGETRPLASNDTAAGRMQNRRIEIILKK